MFAHSNDTNTPKTQTSNSDMEEPQSRWESHTVQVVRAQCMWYACGNVQVCRCATCTRHTWHFTCYFTHLLLHTCSFTLATSPTWQTSSFDSQKLNSCTSPLGLGRPTAPSSGLPMRRVHVHRVHVHRVHVHRGCMSNGSI